MVVMTFLGRREQFCLFYFSVSMELFVLSTSVINRAFDFCSYFAINEMQNVFWQAVTLDFPISISTPEYLNGLTPVSLAYAKQNFYTWCFLPIICHLEIK